ncbi:MAG TPA: 3'-5' exonuclease [Elusimicrobiales bacterium]|nr:3'-5' exonuclease [Elusimicrobiales bacterium]
MQNKLISQVSFSFIDTETTALCPSEFGRICEIAVIKIGPGGQTHNLSSLINPQVPIPKSATAIHSITNYMVENKPTFDRIVPSLTHLMQGSVLVFHHAGFDVPFLEHEFTNAGLKFPNATVLDTLKYARKHGAFKSNSLGNIVSELGLSNDGWHRALADAKMTKEVFFHFVDKFKKMGFKTLGDLIHLQTKKLTSPITAKD